MRRGKSTKDKIIELLKVRMLRLTDISKKLDLSASTILEHLNDLERKGRVHTVVLRSKYYKAEKK